MTAPTIEAKLLWECQNQLGEGILWDSDAKAVRWVDLKVAEIHSLNPETKAYTIDKYPETQFVTAIALRQNKQDLIGLTQDAVAVLPVSTPSSSSATSPKDAKPTEHKIGSIVAQPLTDLTSEGIEMRFNDGGCDPAGRMYAGSTNHSPGADFRGEFWRVEVDGTSSRVFDKIGCSNGLGWSPDHKTMYYIDSAIDKIRAFDYDLATGQLSNEREFQPSPAPLEPGSKTQGCFDGLTMDGVGNVWVARWSDGRVMGFRPDGSLIANIKVPGCRSPTIPCFGGDKLETMFIASAHTKWLRQGDIQPQFPHSGDVFSVDFGPGSEIRKVLGDDWKGAERYRFAA